MRYVKTKCWTLNNVQFLLRSSRQF